MIIENMRLLSLPFSLSKLEPNTVLLSYSISIDFCNAVCWGLESHYKVIRFLF